MHRQTLSCFFAAWGTLCGLMPILAAEPASYTRTEDVIYGRKYGTALTLDVFTPKEKANGAAVVFVVSGGFVSAHEMINIKSFERILRRGYTLFPVVHGSQPEYTVPEIIEDMYRSVRFIRHNAQRFHIDADRIGVLGASSGGHLSLMLGLAAPTGRPDAKDPVDRESSRVQAVACFFPPTDFMNIGRPGHDLLQALGNELAGFEAPFDFKELNPQTHRMVLIEDRDRRLKIVREISPITHVTADDAPTLIIQGDADKMVSVQQGQDLKERLDQAQVPAKLVVKPGAGHGWPDIQNDMETMADWFDTYLLGQPATRPTNGKTTSAPEANSPK